MTRLEYRVVINAPIHDVFDFHDDTRNLVKITPPSIKVSFTTVGKPGAGLEVKLLVRQWGILPMRWHVRITEHERPYRMVDEQVSGPFRSWKQTRLLREVGSATELTDIVEYELPLAPLSSFAGGSIVRGQIDNMFRYRQQRTKDLLEAASESRLPSR